MAYLKSSNLLMACLLGAKASFFLVAPVQSAVSNSSGETSVHSFVEVEVVNLIKANESSEDPRLVAQESVDQNQDLNQDLNQDVNQDVAPTQARFFREV